MEKKIAMTIAKIQGLESINLYFEHLYYYFFLIQILTNIRNSQVSIEMKNLLENIFASQKF